MRVVSTGVGTLEQIVSLADKYLGLGILTIPVLVFIFFIILKKTFNEAVKIAVIIFLVMIFIKYSVITITKNFI